MYLINAFETLLLFLSFVTAIPVLQENNIIMSIIFSEYKKCNVDFSRIKRIQKDFSFFQGDLVDVDFFLLYYLKRGI